LELREQLARRPLHDQPVPGADRFRREELRDRGTPLSVRVPVEEEDGAELVLAVHLFGAGTRLQHLRATQHSPTGPEVPDDARARIRLHSLRSEGAGLTVVARRTGQRRRLIGAGDRGLQVSTPAAHSPRRYWCQEYDTNTYWPPDRSVASDQQAGWSRG
jgi:hypothetical protein